MIQLSLNFFPAEKTQGKSTPADPHAHVKTMMEEQIKMVGLVAFKDFFMQVKFGQIVINVEGISKEDYLSTCREVYERRAAELERKKSRSKFFAIKNRIKNR